MLELTTYDMTMKNLNIIRTVFDSQFIVNKKHDLAFPSFVNSEGKHISNGRYLLRFDVLTNSDLFNLNLFKNEMTRRYETSLNQNLLINELREIRNQASVLLSFYNDKLTRENPVVAEIINKDREIGDKENVATIEIIDFDVWIFHFGTDMHSVNGEYLHKEDYKRYICDNQTLARYCAKLELFIDKIGLSPDGNFIRP